MLVHMRMPVKWVGTAGPNDENDGLFGSITPG
jgi:hypothetical protein